jgi:hypothetical protein
VRGQFLEAAEAKATEEAKAAAEAKATEEAKAAAVKAKAAAVKAKATSEAKAATAKAKAAAAAKATAAEAKATEEAKAAAEAKATEEAKAAAEAKATEEAKAAAVKAKAAAAAKATEEAKAAAEAKATEEAKAAAEATLEAVPPLPYSSVSRPRIQGTRIRDGSNLGVKAQEQKLSQSLYSGDSRNRKLALASFTGFGKVKTGQRSRSESRANVRSPLQIGSVTLDD